MRHPTLEETQVCEFHRKLYMEKHKGALISQEEAKSKAVINKQWHPSMDLKVQSLYDEYEILREELEELKEEYKKVAAAKTKIQRLEIKIKKVEKELTSLLHKKQNIFSNTLEYRAEKVLSFID